MTTYVLKYNGAITTRLVVKAGTLKEARAKAARQMESYHFVEALNESTGAVFPCRCNLCQASRSMSQNVDET